MSDASKTGKGPEKVIVRGYPESVFFWPTAITGILIALLSDILIDAAPDFITPGRLGAVFVIVFLFNFMIVTFDFSLGRTVGIFLFLIVLVLVYIIVSPTLFPEDNPTQQLLRLSLPEDFSAGPFFYLIMSGGILVILIVAFVFGWFSYWEIRSTEIYHHHGLFADTKRYPAQGAFVRKETPDIFERILFRSANIIIIPSETKEVIHINNVWNASGKEKRIREVLSYVPDSAT
ncbi:MAG: hypothetical protein ACFFD4_06540 [Candidatus Odinarchaeota archaeon]